MDIATRRPEIDPEASCWEDVLLNGQKTGLRLQIRSSEHPDLKKVAHRMSGRMIRQGVLMKGMSAEEQDEAIGRNTEQVGVEQAVAVTVGWEWGEDADGEPFTYNGEVWEFNEDNLCKIFELLPEAVETANAVAVRVENFTRPSSKSSPKQSE